MDVAYFLSLFCAKSCGPTLYTKPERHLSGNNDKEVTGERTIQNEGEDRKTSEKGERMD